MQKIKGEADLKKLQKNSGHVVLLLHSNTCPHCQEDLRDLKEDCKSFKGTPITFAECELSKNEGCRELWERARPQNIPEEEYGYPVKVGLNPDSDISDPIWFIHGRSPDQMNMVLSKLKEAVSGSEPESAPRPYHQPPRQPQAVNPYRAFAAQYVATPPPRSVLHRVNSSSEGTLCINCDREEMQRKMKAFILGW